MPRGPAILACIAFLIAGAFLVVFLTRPEEPALAVVAPFAGQVLVEESTTTVAWQASGIPRGYRIALAIRRLPPPPLLAEGQEFDPVTATDLPDTGDYVWHVSSMYPEGTYVMSARAYNGTPATKEASAESAPFTIVKPLANDLFPLYAAPWGAPHPADVVIGSTTLSGVAVEARVATSTLDPGSAITPFDRYYDRLLKAAGWKIANEYASGGHVGGQTGYTKGGATILTEFRIEYGKTPPNAPSECPCTVTLSLFSGEQR